jgi:predicted transcriptional regulator
MWTTNPELTKLLANPEDGYKYFQGSNKKVDWKCPKCNSIIKNKSISNVKSHGLSCNSCSDGISYPNKIMYNLLNQLIDFIPEYCPKWLKSKRYDFYFIKDNNEYIVEMDGGMGHGNYNTLSKMTPEESLAIDKYKEELAIQHNIKIIRIDCLKSELEYIKTNVLNSKLNVVFDLSKVDWLECHKLSLNSFVKTACELWNTLEYSVKDIGNLLKLNPSTIVGYLKKGTQIYWCKYNSEEEKIKNLKDMTSKSIKATSKKVRCIETNQIFNSITEASRKMNCSDPHISSCCKGKRKTCGKLEDGTKLHWEYI